MKNNCCSACGANLTKYKEKINSGIVSALHKIARYESEVSIRKIGLTPLEWTNFTRLKYWDFAEHGSKRGFWRATETGRSFLRSEISVQPICWTFRGEVIQREGDEVLIESVYDSFDTIEDFIRYRTGHTPKQLDLV